MNNSKELVLVFQVKNTQNSYARCLSAINHFEDDILNSGKSAEGFYRHAKTIPSEEFTFQVNQRSNGPNDKMESPLKPSEYARIPVSEKEEEKKLLKDAIEFWQKNPNKSRRPLYHIRVEFDYEPKSGEYKNIENLQFLAMLMQQVFITCFKGNTDFAPDKLKERLSIFLIPHTGVTYRFAGEDTAPDCRLYSQASQYLGLIAKMHTGVIHAYKPNDKSDKPDKVSALDFTKRKRNKMLLPLLYLGEGKVTVKDNYSAIFDTEGMPNAKTIESALRGRYHDNDPKPFGKANEKNPHEAIADTILNEARAWLLNIFAFKDNPKKVAEESDENKMLELGRENIEKYITQITDHINIDKCDRFSFALFCYLFVFDKDDETVIRKTITNTMKLACELGNAVRQIVQNSIQHSQYHACYISFFKEKNINNEYQICVRVTDLNSQKTIIETFHETLKTDGKYEDFSNIKITIAQLLSEFDSQLPDNVLEAWYNFRKKDSVAHIGLIIFNNILKKCQCKNLHIISSKERFLDKEYNEFIGGIDYANKTANTAKEVPVIPGTQIYFAIPIKPFLESLPVNLVQLDNNNAFSENYEAFAHYLDYTVSKNLWAQHEKDLTTALEFCKNERITSAISKIAMQKQWEKFWKNLLDLLPDNLKKIHWYDIQEATEDFRAFLSNKDNCEIFIKGFFAIASDYRIKNITKDKIYEPSCFYFENLPSHFVDILLEVGVSLSFMDFSQNLQVFFSCKEEKEKNNEPKYLSRQISLLGKCIGYVIQNAYIMSLEHGEKNIEQSYYNRASELLLPYAKVLKQENKEEKECAELKVCPFTVFELDKSQSKPQYFEQLKKIAEQPLVHEDKSKRGYQFKDIHMRLGNKLHLDSFFEMSFLFYRTSVANRAAFYILQKIKETLKEMLDSHEKNNKEGKIVFYGYASYSQALVFSLCEILKIYFDTLRIKNVDKKVFYAAYQYNLQSETDYYGGIDRHTDKIQIYSTLDEDEDENENKNRKVSTFVVQIVPIATTLTTFDKMREKYEKDRGYKESSKIISNFNIFLVRDKNGKRNTLSEIEGVTWESIDSDKCEIIVKGEILRRLRDNPKVSYIINADCRWYRPIDCQHCFPKDVTNEHPLIETDPTSTVPTLQIYQEPVQKKELIFQSENTDRLKELSGCVYYGHFARGKNHYQFYINTQEYISKSEVKKKLKKWLQGERKKEDLRIHDEPVTPLLNIIFAPEHNTNVGFSQIVNTYFFNGTAEIVSINVDKQYRSNFICEHDALKQTISRLHEENRNKRPVRFFFVDDAIVTGGSYYRARDLLGSLIPNEYKILYPNFLFSKCFFLIDRTSQSTQESYVLRPSENFLAFCRINISNMRKQGDSCIGCKLKFESESLFKRSSTRSFANYWAKKTQDYTPQLFNKIDKENHDKAKAFIRLLLTHAFTSIIKNSNSVNYGEAIGSIFRIVLQEPLSPHENENYREGIDLVRKSFEVLHGNSNEKILCLLEHAIKILTRPFLFYNFKLKKDVLRFIIRILEAIWDDNPRSGKDTVLENLKSVLLSVSLNRQLYFVQDCLFKAFADMKSTYLLRKETIKKAYLFSLKYTDQQSKDACRCYSDNEKDLEFCIASVQSIKNKSDYPCENSLIRCYWKKYAFQLHRILDGSDDETRSLWMEYLLTSGEEKSTEKEAKKGSIEPLYESIISDSIFLKTEESAKGFFREFCREIFLQNSRLLYDGIKKKSNSDKKQNESETQTDSTEDNYFLKNIEELRKRDFEWASIGTATINDTITTAEIALFDFISEKNEKDTEKKYKEFIETIHCMIKSKYQLENTHIDIALIVEKDSDGQISMNTLDILNYYQDDSNKQEVYKDDKLGEEERTIKAKTTIKKRIMCALGKNNPPKIYTHSRLVDDGYCLILPDSSNTASVNYNFDEDNDNTFYQKPFFILRFDNDLIKKNSELNGRLESIEKVYLYVGFNFPTSEIEMGKIIPILVMRDILLYRNSIMHIFEQDFNSYLMQAWAKKNSENTIMFHEKAVSHSTNSDDKLTTLLWKFEGEPTEEDYEWLLFRNYTNTQIAKLFNRTLSLLSSRQFDTREPKLYLPESFCTEKQDDTFTSPAIDFKGVFNLDSSDDRRVILCSKIIDFFGVNDLKNSKIISATIRDRNGSQEKYYFNKEYLKCILFDIFLSAAKYWHEDVDFLKRVEALMELKRGYAEAAVDSMSKKSYDKSRCKLLLIHEKNNLIIINPARKISNHILNRWEEETKMIKNRLSNPYDSFDGHLSLFTISNYIKGIWGKELKEDSIDELPSFEYYELKELPLEWQNSLCKNWGGENQVGAVPLWFVSKLPILEEESL